MKLLKKNFSLFGGKKRSEKASHQSGWLYVLMLAGCLSFNVQADGLTVEFKNGTKTVPNDQIYILAMGKMPGTEEPCFIKITNGAGVCTRLSETTKSAEFSIPLPDASVTMPQIISGRVYMSVGHPVDLYVKKEGNKFSIIEPDSFKLKDSNYYVLYDKFEYTYKDTGLYVNPTAVDFFSLPISLKLDTQSTRAKFKEAGLTATRQSVIDRVKATFNEDKNYSADWSKLILTYPTENNVLRVIAPGKAMYKESNPAHYFPEDFLKKGGYNYIDELWNFYADGKGNTLRIDLAEKGLGIVTGTTIGNSFVFKGADSLDKPSSSIAFFGAGGTFHAENGTTKALIVRQLTSAFDAGILPRPGATLLKFKDDHGDKISCEKMKTLNPGDTCTGKYAFDYYQQNPTWRGTGPWYDLYSKALHSFGEKQPTYTFAYDDALAQDGTISIPAADVPGSKLIVTLGDMTGTGIAKFEGDNKVYNNVSFEIGAKNIIRFTNAEGKPEMLKANATANVKSPFQIEFCDAKGNKQTTRIYLKPAMVRPFVEGSDGIILNVDNLKITFPGLNVECKIN